MAVGFGQAQGAAKKSGVSYMKLAEGENHFRIVGDLLPGYSYWVKGKEGKDAPFECLSYVRDEERFDNSLPDPVKELGIIDKEGKPLRCSWSYKCQVINRATGKLEVLQLKKGMLKDIIKISQQTGMDPSDIEEGFDIYVTREKTGPLAYNVEYNVNPFKVEKTALSDSDRELIAEMKPIDELFPKESAADQRKRLDRHLNGEREDAAEQEAAKEAISELED